MTTEEDLRMICKGIGARRSGRDAHMLRTGKTNPHQKGSFERMCWDAGNVQDVRSVEQLLAAFKKEGAS